MLHIKTRPALILLLLLSKPNPLRWASVWLWKRPFHEIEYLSNCCVSSQASYRLRRVFMLHIKTRPALILLLLAFGRDLLRWIRGRVTEATQNNHPRDESPGDDCFK